MLVQIIGYLILTLASSILISNCLHNRIAKIMNWKNKVSFFLSWMYLKKVKDSLIRIYL